MTPLSQSVLSANIKHTSDLYLTKCRTHEYHDEVNKLNTEGQWSSYFGLVCYKIKGLK
jgi:hypothetical protein